MSDLAAALDIVGARWALLVVERLLDGPRRYGDLQRDLGVPTNILATRLRELEAAGVLTRLPLRHNTRAYALTDRGLALREAIVALGAWGKEAVATRQRVAAYGVARRDDAVLLVRASSRTGVPGTWWLPGGGVEFGESPEGGLVREFMEETGLGVRVRDVLVVVSDVANLASEQVRLHSIRILYEVQVETGTVRPETDGSSDAVRWVPYGELEALPLVPWLGDLAPTHLAAP